MCLRFWRLTESESHPRHELRGMLHLHLSPTTATLRALMPVRVSCTSPCVHALKRSVMKCADPRRRMCLGAPPVHAAIGTCVLRATPSAFFTLRRGLRRCSAEPSGMRQLRWMRSCPRWNACTVCHRMNTHMRVCMYTHMRTHACTHAYALARMHADGCSLLRLDDCAFTSLALIASQRRSSSASAHSAARCPPSACGR